MSSGIEVKGLIEIEFPSKSGEMVVPDDKSPLAPRLKIAAEALVLPLLIGIEADASLLSSLLAIDSSIEPIKSFMLFMSKTSGILGSCLAPFP